MLLYGFTAVQYKKKNVFLLFTKQVVPGGGGGGGVGRGTGQEVAGKAIELKVYGIEVRTLPICYMRLS